MKRLKTQWRDALTMLIKDGDATIDSLITPDINTKLIEPLINSLPIGDGEAKNKAATEFKALVSNFTSKLEVGKQNPLVLGAIIGGAVMFVLPQLINSLLQPVYDKYLTRNMVKLTRSQLLNIEQYFDSWRRGVITEAQFTERMKESGLEDIDITGVKTILQQIPSVQDIIRFSIREVYRPDVVAKFGMDGEFDKVVTQAAPDLYKVGMSEDNLRKYWRAHWDLPSVSLGYDMLHRGIITNEEMKLLLETQDFMPFWRDKMIQAAYEPYTRVDIRRMYSLNILKEADLVKAYKDIGYDDAHAQQLTQFTVLYENNKEELEQTKLDKQKSEYRDLSKSDILNGYKLKYITKSNALDMLKTLQLTDAEIEYLIGRIDYLNVLDDNDRVIKIYHDAYTKGIYERTKIIELLGKLNVPADYQNYLLAVWDIERSIKVAVPTKAEVIGFYKKSIISETRARDELSKMGYTAEVVDWYIKGSASVATEG